MAHRKLQQEIDRVFKKINEGLDIFDTFHERHENATNPSQKDKLEADLKREIKKLQKLREQIKVWQTQNEVKDKDKLLEYRRLVEVAMEKYKVVEKGSKVKAYSNMSLKQGVDLDPEEQEKQDTINFIQESIDDLERQYQSIEVELEKLSSKKSKKSSNDSKKEELKEFQEKYRWHQQNLEIALRLLENDELQPSDINEIKEDLTYFLQSNRDANFIDNEYIYEPLDLESNEVLTHEVMTSFNGVNEKHDDGASDSHSTPTTTAAIANTATTPVKEPIISKKIKEKEVKEAVKPKKIVVSSSSIQPAATTPSILSPLQATNETLKPATAPIKQPEMKWSALAAAAAAASAAAAPSHPPQASTPVAPSPQLMNKTIINPHSGFTSPSSKDTTPEPEKSNSSTNNNNNNNLTTQNSNSSVSTINELEYQQDAELVKLPPGIQDMISSFMSCRRKGNNEINNVSKLLDTPRDFLVQRLTSPPPSLEALRVSNIWNLTRLQVLDRPEILKEIDNGTLFYAFYFCLTPYENHLVEQELIKRQWRSDLNKTNWYQRINQPIKQGANFEISNFKKFDSLNWNLVDLINYQLDYDKLTS